MISLICKYYCWIHLFCLKGWNIQSIFKCISVKIKVVLKQLITLCCDRLIWIELLLLLLLLLHSHHLLHLHLLLWLILHLLHLLLNLLLLAHWSFKIIKKRLILTENTLVLSLKHRFCTPVISQQRITFYFLCEMSILKFLSCVFNDFLV